MGEAERRLLMRRETEERGRKMKRWEVGFGHNCGISKGIMWLPTKQASDSYSTLRTIFDRGGTYIRNMSYSPELKRKKDSLLNGLKPG